MYCESLWNHVVIQQGVFNRLKITYCIATSITQKIHKESNFSNSQFLEKMQKLICNVPKSFANCELQMANLNPVYICVISIVSIISLMMLCKSPSARQHGLLSKKIVDIHWSLHHIRWKLAEDPFRPSKMLLIHCNSY